MELPDVRKYLTGFLYRTAVCTCLFLLCWIVGELWPGALAAFKSRLFYTVNYGQMVKDLEDLARCVLPG